MIIHMSGDYKSVGKKISSSRKNADVKRYIFLESAQRGIDRNGQGVDADRVTIVNIVNELRFVPLQSKDRIGYSKTSVELVTRVASYYGRYIPYKPGKITYEDIIEINESHYNVSYNATGRINEACVTQDQYLNTQNNKSYTGFEIYLSYDHAPFDGYAKRRTPDGKEQVLDDPFPEYFTMDDQIENIKSNIPFGYHLVNDLGGVYRTQLKNLVDQNFTEIQRINFSNVLSANKHEDIQIPTYTGYRGSNVGELYGIIAMVKYAMESHGFRKSMVIFDIEKGFRIVEDYLDFMTEVKDQTVARVQFMAANMHVSDIFNNHFRPVFEYEGFVLYMYFAPYTNKVDIIYPYIDDPTQQKDKIDIPADVLAEEIVSMREMGV